MRKVLLCAALCTGISFVASAQNVFQLTRKGGSPSGFQRVDQKTDGDGNTKMTCIGSGQTNSDYTAPPNRPELVDMNKIIAYVNNEIRLGNLSGKAVIEGLPTEWNGSDIFNYTLTAGKVAEK